jgi:UDP-2,3-diacylglucosamine pyrophosphatase LpxH
MAVRRLIISDVHFGSGDDLLCVDGVLDRIEPELAWADEIVINGDLLELVFASLEDAVRAARPFMALVGRHVERIHYVVGNHDHHLVSLARDERRLREVLGEAAPAASGVAAATHLLRSLCPGTEVVAAYPTCELDGMLFMHGHYIATHGGSADHWLMDGLAARLTGAARPERLTVEDYEALITPLYELMYEVANLPTGRQAQQRIERLLRSAAAITVGPRHASHRLAALMRVASHNHLEGPTAARAAAGSAVAAMQAVCENLDIRPGTVVFGHTHVPLDAVATPDGRYQLFNSGSWVWDRRRRDHDSHGGERRWPGTVLRATGGVLELRGLLDDCDERELDELVCKNHGRGVAHGRMDTFVQTLAARTTGAVGKGTT